MSPKLVVAAILVVLVGILVVQNTEVVTVSLLFWNFKMSRVILILLATMSGFICGYLVARLTSRRPDDPGAR